MMCGVAAYFLKAPDLRSEHVRAAVLSMTDQMTRRGPDGQGFWQDDLAALGHRRLAILDLDARSAQPMHSRCGRYTIVFNGEIYNYQSLRAMLLAEGFQLRTTSDTEVLLALFACRQEAMLPLLHGMFAFVIWDRVAARAFAARDPYGIKPLYVAHVGDGVMVASQVKALLETGRVSRIPDPHGQAAFWMLGSVPEPHTWYRDVSPVPAGHCLWIERGAITHQRAWHDIGAAWRSTDTESGEQLPAHEIQSRVGAALRESIGRHLVADVPVGVFLSGGIDSGAIAALMVEAGAKDVQGVTIVYDEFAGSGDDEGPAACELARHYGITHHVRRVTREEFAVDLPRILAAMDQPSIDGINTWYASKAMSELGLKVVLSGVGGDELFLGYESFRQLPRLVNWWQALSKVPGMMAAGQVAAEWRALMTRNSRWRHAPEWARSMAGAWWLRRSVQGPEGVPMALAGSLEDFSAQEWIHATTGSLPLKLPMALAQIESMNYLRNQLLRDSDWASMDHSVELRTPLVDAHLLEQLRPLLSCFEAFPKKSLLANAPREKLPASITRRRKTGFGIPVQRWIREIQQPVQADQRHAWMHTVARMYA
jgi:asparagine synthase (glutamine-hydrolysing)